MLQALRTELRGVSSPEGSRRSRGFTILEILIAIVILVIGITGIVALFPTAIESGNKTVEDSYAAAITQSVIDAISVGLRESKYSYAPPTGGGQLFHYFILDHDGVLDPAVPDGKVNDYAAAGLWSKDYTILLPRAQNPDNKDPLEEPWFHYPVCASSVGSEWSFLPPTQSDDPRDPAPGKLGTQKPCDNQALGNMAQPNTSMKKPTARSTDTQPHFEYWYRRTYPLGRYREGAEPGNDPAWRRAIRREFLGNPIGNLTNPGPGDFPIIDPYPQYSFAIAIQRAKIDNTGPGGVPDGKITLDDKFSDNLYQVRIMIFRNFDSTPALHQRLATDTKPIIPKNNIPIREFITLMSI